MSEKIIRLIAKELQVPYLGIVSELRVMEYVQARRIYTHIGRRLGFTHQRISNDLRQKDHTSSIHRANQDLTPFEISILKKVERKLKPTHHPVRLVS
jgi:chromosomal replication initiation ATPase DnaA